MDQEGMFYTVAEADVKQVFEKGLPLHFTRQVGISIRRHLPLTLVSILYKRIRKV